MTDRPILFSAPMIRALMDGRKTQTRRVLKRLTRFGPITEFGPSATAGYDWNFRDKEMRWHDLTQAELEKVLPYAPGDRLWVREAWKTHSLYDHLPPSQVPESTVFYRADNAYAPSGARWRPSIFMPSWASRLTLTVTEVRVQRLQDISDEDAEAEGATGKPKSSGYRNAYSGWCMNWPATEPAEGWGWVSLNRPRLAFASYWNDINGPDAWSADPWVVALSFDVHKGNIDQVQP